jgi:hypothetical protein
VCRIRFWIVSVAGPSKPLEKKKRKETIELEQNLSMCVASILEDQEVGKFPVATDSFWGG